MSCRCSVYCIKVIFYLEPRYGSRKVHTLSGCECIFVIELKLSSLFNQVITKTRPTGRIKVWYNTMVDLMGENRDFSIRRWIILIRSNRINYHVYPGLGLSHTTAYIQHPCHHLRTNMSSRNASLDHILLCQMRIPLALAPPLHWRKPTLFLWTQPRPILMYWRLQLHHLRHQLAWSSSTCGKVLMLRLRQRFQSVAQSSSTIATIPLLR